MEQAVSVTMLHDFEYAFVLQVAGYLEMEPETKLIFALLGSNAGPDHEVSERIQSLLIRRTRVAFFLPEDTNRNMSTKVDHVLCRHKSVCRLSRSLHLLSY